MIGAVIGDVIGSHFERRNNKRLDFDLFNTETRFTDDTVLSVAVADCILSNNSYATKIHQYANAYPEAGYGSRFRKWLLTDGKQPYQGNGNGAAMRVSPIGFAFSTLEEVLDQAKKSAEVTHNHPEGIKGAQATAVCVFMAHSGKSKREIKKYIESEFGYDLSQSIEEIRPTYSFDSSCEGSVPQAICAFMNSQNYMHAIRLGISLGGDSDTLACIAGGIAQAYYGGVPEDVKKKVYRYLNGNLLEIINRFGEKFKCS